MTTCSSEWVIETRGGFIVRTPYHPEIGPLLRQIGQWSFEERAWRVPRSAQAELANMLPTIARLARQSNASVPQAARAVDHPPIPLQREYLVPDWQAPRHLFEIEKKRSSNAQTWIAQILATDPRRNWVRVFLDGTVDYGRSTSRTLVITYALFEGPIYEVCRLGKRGKETRGFLRIENGERRWLTERELQACLDR